MDKESTKKLAFDKLKEDYTNKYIVAAIVESAIALLKVVAIIVTSFYIAWKVGDPIVGGGPASLLRICAVGLCVMIVYFTRQELKEEKKRLAEEYKQQKTFLYFKLNS